MEPGQKIYPLPYYFRKLIGQRQLTGARYNIKRIDVRNYIFELIDQQFPANGSTDGEGPSTANQAAGCYVETLCAHTTRSYRKEDDSKQIQQHAQAHEHKSRDVIPAGDEWWRIDREKEKKGIKSWLT